MALNRAVRTACSWITATPYACRAIAHNVPRTSFGRLSPDGLAVTIPRVISALGVTSLALLAVGAVAGAAMGWFAVVSAREHERRASRIAAGLALALPVVFTVTAFQPEPLPSVVLVAVGLGGVAVLATCVWPIGQGIEPSGRADRRVDERDIMFARGRLVPGSPEYEAYYAMRPENLAGDERTRSYPGLMSLAAEKADRVGFACAGASFEITEAVRHLAEGATAGEPLVLPAEQWTARVKELARYYGALDVGVCELRPHHVYSHIGRGTGEWGAPIELGHRWAIAFTVEMDHRTMMHAPEFPVLMESARQYVNAGTTALSLAIAIRNCGWSARAHIDGNYRVIAPLVARDAGLGELGRMGLLMTTGLGPRVRLGVVTTDLELVPDPPGDDTSVLDFCTICKKCAECCPVGAISAGGREPIGAGRRWAIDSEKCYRYWWVVGTDCGRCVSVCPYSHPDSTVHNLVRWFVRRSGGARRLVLWLDDLCYGRRPGRRWLRQG